MVAPDAPLRPRAKINASAQRRTDVRPKLTPRSTPKPRTRDADGRLSPSPSVRIKAKVTLPPHRYQSPPTSTLSFSSRSTRSTDSDPPTDDEHDDDTTHKATAKSNRKIADLEITNRSLLAINASLESTKHSQSKEIRDLRRKLRESRLILPPHTFRAVSASDHHHHPPDDDDDDSDQDESKDEVYVRIKAILENLLDTGRRALQSTPADFVQPGKGGAKVLSPDEVRSWSAGDDDDDDKVGDKEQVDPSHIAVPDDDDDDDDIARTPLVYSPTPSPPPIRISVSKPKR
ncbi:hypothetical protein H2248_001202 [Termitomyces sp. 'cryptogamus']|nr:hypothetical protein H2248_001202 [Termitomyces sp. 'cryptogamus']